MEEVIKAIINDPRNKVFTDKGIMPLMQVSKEARILIVGQAPGRRCEQTKIPFDDPSGDLLRQWLGITKEQFYSNKIAILPMDFYYPGKAKTGDKPPRKFISQDYHEQIVKQMPNIKYIILLGNYASKYYLKDQYKHNLTDTIKYFKDQDSKYIPIVHSSPLNNIWHRKNPWFKEEVIPKIQNKIKKVL